MFLLHHSLTDFEDYGAYWRYNYETIEEEDRFKYSRDELMEDVRSVYKEVPLTSVDQSHLS